MDIDNLVRRIGFWEPNRAVRGSDWIREGPYSTWWPLARCEMRATMWTLITAAMLVVGCEQNRKDEEMDAGPAPVPAPECTMDHDCPDGEICVGGECVEPIPQPECMTDAQCPSENVCMSRTCQSGSCVAQPNMGVECNDGNPDTIDDTCQADFTCAGTAKPPACIPDCSGKECGGNGCGGSCGMCGEGLKCSAGTCGVENGTPCDDADVCTEGETWQNSVCSGGEPVQNCCYQDADCPVDMICAVWQCELDLPDDGTPCDDGNPCTTGECWHDGECSNGKSVVCEGDDNVCTTELCDPASGCVHIANAIACDDGDELTSDDQCENGMCVGQACEPQCDGLECGEDGCGGTCGSCQAGSTCQAGICETPAPPAPTKRLVRITRSYPAAWGELSHISVKGYYCKGPEAHLIETWPGVEGCVEYSAWGEFTDINGFPTSWSWTGGMVQAIVEMPIGALLFSNNSHQFEVGEEPVYWCSDVDGPPAGQGWYMVEAQVDGSWEELATTYVDNYSGGCNACHIIP